jgi:hypothetical protein
MVFQIDLRALRLEDARFINKLRLEENMEQLIGGVKRRLLMSGILCGWKT